MVKWIYYVGCILLLSVFTRAAIDDIIQSVEEEYDRLAAEDGSGKSARPAWDEYTITNRTGEYVKYQLDQIISKQRFEELMKSEDGQKNGNKRAKRNAVASDDLLWMPGRTIPFEIDRDFGEKWTIEILMAMQHVMQHTCVVFTTHTKESNYIKFVPIESGCNSHVGIMGNEQPINLAVPGCMTKATITHEIGHALGLFHEHMRGDRDAHVNVIERNIEKGQENQFRLMGGNEYEDYGKPYDYLSLMHYGRTYYGKKFNATHKHVTMEPLDPAYTTLMGEAPGLSFHDVMILNDMYKCAENCKPVPCDQGAFLGKNCECYCNGTRENPAVPCGVRAPCLLPDSLKPDEYIAFASEGGGAINLTEKLPIESGRSVEIEGVAVDKCGRQLVEAKCNNGIWDNEIKLECVRERCEFDQGWAAEYELFPSYIENNQTDLPHGETLILECLGNPAIFSELYCEFGIWHGVVTPCKGRNCTVEYDVDSRHIYTAAGTDLKDGHIAVHTEVIDAECRFDSEAYDVTNITCIDGAWIGDLPRDCPKFEPHCAVVADATVTSHSTEPDRFTINCLSGFDLVDAESHNKLDSSSFRCDRRGAWRPNTPLCHPASCTLPAELNGVIKNKNNIEVPFGAIIESGNDVTLHCNRGHAPDVAKITCLRGEWISEEAAKGSFPVCIKVECPPPQVKGAPFVPRQKTYLYKDKVDVGRCKKNNHEFVGSNQLTCLRNGTWSGTATCQSYCMLGKSAWRRFSGQQVNLRGARIRSAKTYSSCKKKCKEHEGFLCRSFSFGYVAGSQRPICRLHKLDLIENQDKLKVDVRFYAAARVCK